MVRVKTAGLGKIKKNASEIEKKLTKALNGALIQSALVDVETVAKKKITNDGHVDTGRLRASIHTTYKGKESYNYRDIQGENFTSKLNVKRTDSNVFVGTDVKYAGKIEALDSYLFYAFKNAEQKTDARLKRAMKKVLKEG